MSEGSALLKSTAFMGIGMVLGLCIFIGYAFDCYQFTAILFFFFLFFIGMLGYVLMEKADCPTCGQMALKSRIKV